MFVDSERLSGAAANQTVRNPKGIVLNVEGLIGSIFLQADIKMCLCKVIPGLGHIQVQFNLPEEVSSKTETAEVKVNDLIMHANFNDSQKKDVGSVSRLDVLRMTNELARIYDMGGAPFDVTVEDGIFDGWRRRVLHEGCQTRKGFDGKPPSQSALRDAMRHMHRRQRSRSTLFPASKA